VTVAALVRCQAVRFDPGLARTNAPRRRSDSCLMRRSGWRGSRPRSADGTEGSLYGTEGSLDARQRSGTISLRSGGATALYAILAADIFRNPLRRSGPASCGAAWPRPRLRSLPLAAPTPRREVRAAGPRGCRGLDAAGALPPIRHLRSDAITCGSYGDMSGDKSRSSVEWNHAGNGVAASA